MINFSLLVDLEVNLEDEIRVMIIFYFLSLNKPEFTEFAQEFAEDISKDKCLAMAWYLSSDYRPTDHTEDGREEFNELMVFIKDYCKQKGLTMMEWLKTLMQDFELDFMIFTNSIRMYKFRK